MILSVSEIAYHAHNPLPMLSNAYLFLRGHLLAESYKW